MDISNFLFNDGYGKAVYVEMFTDTFLVGSSFVGPIKDSFFEEKNGSCLLKSVMVNSHSLYWDSSVLWL